MDHVQDYDLNVVRQLLLDAFSADSLRRLVYYSQRRILEPLLHDWSPNDGPAAMVDKTIVHCQKEACFDDLLAEVETANPRQYEHYRDRLLVAGPAVPPAGPAPEATRQGTRGPVRPKPRSASSTAPRETATSAADALRPACEPADTITWLHLSDLHFREGREGTSYDESIVLDALLKDLAERIAKDDLRPEFIVVTGDIAHAGRTAEYRLASRFFDELLRITELDKDCLFLVPGNHDVDRRRISEGARLIGSSLTDRERVNKVLATASDRRLMLARFRGYKAFIKKYLAGHPAFDDNNYFYVKTFEVAGRVVSVLGLNSAWASASNEDRNHLLLGERQVRNALAAAGTEPVICLALMHHPFDWLHDFDRADAEALLRGRCQFILHGHMHDVGLRLTRDPDAECLVIAAGACYETRKYPNSYNMVRLDFTAGQGTVHLRTYSDRDGGFWAKDTTSYRDVPEGVWTFPLPSSIATSPPTPAIESGQRSYRWPSQWKDSRPPQPPGIEAWCKQAGLTFNPFGPERAEDDPLLLRLVVEPPGWQLMTALAPALIWGEGGSGRTASRLYLEHTCRTRRLDPQGGHEGPIDTFPVTWIFFPESCENAEHSCWRSLTWALSEAVLRFLAHNPGAWSATPPEQQLALGRLLHLHRDRLGDLQHYLRAAGGGSLMVQALVKDLQRTLSTAHAPDLAVIGEMLHVVQRARISLFRHTFLMLEIQDGVPAQLQPDIAHSLDTLLRLAHLLASRGVYLKLFIPTAVRQQLPEAACTEFAGCGLVWSEPALWQMLDFRVRQANESPFNALFRRPPQGVDPARELVRAALQAAGPPRELIRLGQTLLARHAGLEPRDHLLLWTELKAVLAGKEAP